MKHNVNAAVDIFHTRVAYQSHLYTYFLMLQALISDVATVVYQCCDRPFDGKNLIRRPDASSVADNMFCSSAKPPIRHHIAFSYGWKRREQIK